MNHILILPFLLSNKISKRTVEETLKLTDYSTLSRAYESVKRNPDTSSLLLTRMTKKLKLAADSQRSDLWSAKLLYCLDQTRKDFTNCEKMMVKFSARLISSDLMDQSIEPNTITICCHRLRKYLTRIIKLSASPDNSTSAGTCEDIQNLFISYTALTILIIFVLEKQGQYRLTTDNLKDLYKIFNCLIQKSINISVMNITSSSESDSEDDSLSDSVRSGNSSSGSAASDVCLLEPANLAAARGLLTATDQSDRDENDSENGQTDSEDEEEN